MGARAEDGEEGQMVLNVVWTRVEKQNYVGWETEAIVGTGDW